MSPEQIALRQQKRDQRAHSKLVRDIFAQFGFSEDLSLREKDVLFNKCPSELDGVFVFENVVVITELTARKKNASEHLGKKAHLYKEAVEHPVEFVAYLKTLADKGSALLASAAHKTQFKVVALYCPFTGEVGDNREKYPYIKFASIENLLYFRDVARSVKSSGRNEFLSFLDVEYGDLPTNSNTSQSYSGTVLPEAHSNFADGYKVVSFYATPEWLLSQSYVLRKGGWRTDDGLYQRMIGRNKLAKIRQYLLGGGNVFVNNIVVSLPAETSVSKGGKPVEFKNISTTTQVSISIPSSFSSVGLIDGQHRVFAYHEGGSKDDVMLGLRARQNILVTGIVRPPELDETSARRFEAKLFLEINATQTKTNAELTQAIEVWVKPFTETSLARRVVNRLNQSGPLAEKFEAAYGAREKLKVASVVNYGVKPLIRFNGTDTLFVNWEKKDKAKLQGKPTLKLADEYVTFCTEAIRSVFIELKRRIPKSRWITKRNDDQALLSTVAVNGMMVLMRKIIEHEPAFDFNGFEGSLKGVENFDFSNYKSSHYGDLGEALYGQYFS